MSKVRPVRIIVDSSCDAAPEVRASAIGSVVGTHAGPGAVAVAFIEKE